MKRYLFPLMIFLLGTPLLSFAQDTVDTTDMSATAKMLFYRSYQFKAVTVLPMTGKEKNVDGDNYALKITKDQLVADLPYFGKSTTAPIENADVGMKFSSKDFSYESNELTKQREQITIKPKDASDIIEIYMIVYPDGSADLRITSLSRQAISYHGKIEAIK